MGNLRMSFPCDDVDGIVARMLILSFMKDIIGAKLSSMDDKNAWRDLC